MPIWKNLSVIRKLVQLLAFLFLVYGSTIVGFYAADKLSGAFPVISCSYEERTADACVLMPLQHNITKQAGTILKADSFDFTMLLPIATTLGTFIMLFVVLNKAFCGWLCPLGTFQEWLGIIGQKLGLQRSDSLEPALVDKIRPVKWIMLGLLVIILPVLSGINMAGAEFAAPYCKVCPSRILTTLAAGQLNHLYIDTSSTGYMILSIIADTLFGLIVVLALTIRQPFCRICPILAMHAIFSKIGLVRLTKNYTSRCDKCGLCAKACPMDIREIHTSQEKDILFPDCTLCGRCVEFCPDQGEMSMKYGVIPIKVSSPEYFKERNKAQKIWEGKKKTVKSAEQA